MSDAVTGMSSHRAQAHGQDVEVADGHIAERKHGLGFDGRTGLALDDFEFYRVFALWRLAAIVEGAYVLFRHGKVADDYSRRLEHDVPALLEEAACVARLRTGA